LGSEGIGSDDIVDGDGYAASTWRLPTRHPRRRASRVRINMRRTIVTSLAAITLAAGTQSASAVIVDSCVHEVKHGYRRNAVWPWPYFCADRMAVREPFDIMVRNGWQRQNLLGAHYFDPATHQLTTAGKMQVRWILTQAPPDRRQIFIERSIDPTLTSEYVAATREYASRVAIDGQMPQIYETNMMAEGRPANAVDMINVRFMENMPLPVLPAASTEDIDQ
jgi:hypothetical protein